MKKHKAVCLCKKELHPETTDDECGDCDEKFKSSTYLRKHKKDYHNIRTISMSPKSKKKRDNEIKEQEENMNMEYNDTLQEETKRVLILLELASWEEDRIDDEKMDQKTDIPEPNVIKKRKRTEVEASKNAKRVAKTTANRERNRKEMHTKRKELRN